MYVHANIVASRHSACPVRAANEGPGVPHLPYSLPQAPTPSCRPGPSAPFHGPIYDGYMVISTLAPVTPSKALGFRRDGGGLGKLKRQPRPGGEGGIVFLVFSIAVFGLVLIRGPSRVGSQVAVDSIDDDGRENHL